MAPRTPRGSQGICTFSVSSSRKRSSATYSENCGELYPCVGGRPRDTPVLPSPHPGRVSCGRRPPSDDPSPDTPREWSSRRVAAEAEAAAEPTWSRGWWPRPLRPGLRRCQCPWGYQFLQLSCGHPASFCGQPPPPPREAEAACRPPDWRGGRARWAAATRGPPSAPVAATTASCQHSRATSVSAAGGTARVPSAP